jgi:nucleotide-binding universal stress UspA family protein
MCAQHFLVPLDFSACADCALAHAIGLAATLQARVTLLHVTSLPLVSELDIAPYQAEFETDARRALEACLQRGHDAGVEGSMALVFGVPWREIIAMATTQGADLIIMGTHGRTDCEQLFLGSVAERVVRLAPCPVLVTPFPTAVPTP